jgi:hypothetical protein
MAIQQMSTGKIFLVCLVAAVSTFVATGTAILLTGANRESAIVIVAALVVLLVPLAKFGTATWAWLSWKEAKSKDPVRSRAP